MNTMPVNLFSISETGFECRQHVVEDNSRREMLISIRKIGCIRLGGIPHHKLSCPKYHPELFYREQCLIHSAFFYTQHCVSALVSLR